MKHNQQTRFFSICLFALLVMLRWEAVAYTVGETVWSYKPGLTFRHKPVLQGNQWVVALADDDSPLGGNSYVVWSYRNSGQVYGSYSAAWIGSEITPDFESCAVSPNNVLYAMTDDGHMLAFSDTPALLWSTQVSNFTSPGSGKYGVPHVGNDGNIYVVTTNSQLVCISPQGVVLWRLAFESGISLFPRDTEFTTISQADDGTLYLGSCESGNLTSYRAALFAVNPNGTLKWAFRPGVTSVGPPTAFPGGVAFGSYEGYICAVSHSGVGLWSRYFGDAIHSAPLYHCGRLWFTRYRFAVGIAPPAGINDQSPVTVLITDTSGAIKGFSRRVSWGGIMTPEPLKDGTAFVASYHLATNASIKRYYAGGQASPAVSPDGKIYFFKGTYRDHNILTCVYAGVQPPEATRVIMLSGPLDFGNVPARATGRKAMTIMNAGNTRLKVSSIAYPPGFSGDWKGGIISSGESQIVTVTFSPTAGRAYSGTVTVDSDKTSGANTVAIKGTGILPEITAEQPAGVERASGATVNFGSCACGFSSTPATTVIVKNTGTGPLTVTAMSLGGANVADFSIIKPKLPLVLAPNRSTVVPSTFKPSSPGKKSAVLTITSTDVDEASFVLNLTGLGTDPDTEFPVGGAVNTSLPTAFTSLGEVLSISGLPRGLMFYAATGTIAGRPLVAGAFTAKVSIRGADGKTTVHPMTVRVEALPSWALGSFTSLIEPAGQANATLPVLGGYLTLASSTSGATTGSLKLGARSFAFRGQIVGRLAADRGGDPLVMAAVIITNTKDRAQDIALSLQFLPEDDPAAAGLTGTMTFQGVDYPIQPGWQHVWNAKTTPAFENKDRMLNVAIDNTDPEGPQGDGFATVKLTRAGLATWYATLADGRKATGSFTVSPDGDVLCYAPIQYPNGGAFYALLPTKAFGGFYEISDTPRLNGRWIKLPTTNPKTADRSHRDGFDVDLDISGAEHRVPAKGVLLFGNPAAPLALGFSLEGAGIDSAAQLGDADSLELAAQLFAGNKIGVDNSPFPAGVKFAPKFTAATGAFTGSVRLSDSSPFGGKPLSRTLTYNGLYIPSLVNPAASSVRGFFLLPELPDAGGETISNTPIQSGGLDFHR